MTVLIFHRLSALIRRGSATKPTAFAARWKILRKMELPLQSLSSLSTGRNARLQVCRQVGLASLSPQTHSSIKSSALPETFASVAIASVVVGAAATLLVKRTKASQELETVSRICDDCGGSGICSGCNGEGFQSKKMSEESAEKARTTAKNMATRYTAGLPKKWSYCTKCSSARSCVTCGGSGKLNL